LMLFCYTFFAICPRDRHLPTEGYLSGNILISITKINMSAVGAGTSASRTGVAQDLLGAIAMRYKMKGLQLFLFCHCCRGHRSMRPQAPIAV